MKILVSFSVARVKIGIFCLAAMYKTASSLFSVASLFNVKGGVEILTTPLFASPIFSPDFIILFENLNGGR